MAKKYQHSDVTQYVMKQKERYEQQRSESSDAPSVPMIEVRNVHKSYGTTKILDGVSFTIEPGEIACVMGPSGCGKSTTLKAIIGAHRPEQGEIYIDGTEVTHLDEPQLNRVRRKFGVLFQSAALFNSMTVGENVALPIKHHTELPDSTVEIMVRLKLDLVGLRDAYDLYPAQLSGGMKKRVGLARAIALDPDIVFYDEPSAGLDPVVIGVIDKLIVDLTRKLNITSVVITHEMRSAFRIADKIIMLYDGRVVAVGTPQEILQSDDPLVVQFINGNAEGPILPPTARGNLLDTLLKSD